MARKKAERPELSSEEVLTSFRIIAELIEDTVEAWDWLPWDTWTPEEFNRLANYVDCIEFNNSNVKAYLELLAVDAETED